MNSLSELKNIGAHIQQIILMQSYLQVGFSLEVKNILDKYFLKKYRIEIEGDQFYEALKTFANHIKYRNINVYFRKYFSALKWKFCEYYKR